MSFFNLLLHAIALIAPAWGMALIFVSLTRLVLWRSQWRYAWGINVLANGLLGSLSLLLALVMMGEDGTLLAYTGLVLCNATVQWVLLRR